MAIEVKVDGEMWCVLVNTDPTEGRGTDRAIAWCYRKSTAVRLAKGVNVQGSDGLVRRFPLVVVGNDGNRMVYGPVGLDLGTEEDRRAEERDGEISRVLAKARAAGLTDEELALLSES
jgi:hypothetical protein